MHVTGMKMLGGNLHQFHTKVTQKPLEEKLVRLTTKSKHINSEVILGKDTLNLCFQNEENNKNYLHVFVECSYL